MLLECISPFRRLKGEEGQDIVEFALVLPIIALVLFGVIDYGWIFFNTASVANATREGARFAVMNYQTEVTTPGDLSTLEGEIELNVKNSLPNHLKSAGSNLNVSLTETTIASPTCPTDKCLVVTVSTDLKLFTPVVSTATGSSTYTITRTVTMHKLD